jgi:subtilase family serine protease
MPKRSTQLALIAVPTLIASLAVPGIATASPTATTATIAHTKPLWISHAKNAGPAAASAGVSARVYLAPNGGTAALAAFAKSVSTPGSVNFHKFLSTRQYYARFGTTDSTVSKVTSYLTSAGLRVTGVEAHNRYISITGSVAAADRAFGTSIQRYSHDGQNVQAPASDLRVPTAIAGALTTVDGLDTTVHVNKPASPDVSTSTSPAFVAPGGFRNGRPCSIYYGQIRAKYRADFQTPLPQFMDKTLSYAPCGYTGPQFRAAYEGNTSLTGAGVTVAITDAYASPTITRDALEYARRHGDGGYAPGQFTQAPFPTFNRRPLCGPSGWFGEETLDVEAVHAMATGANIRFYASASCFDSDFLDTLGRVVDDNIAKLVTNSWSDVEEAESPDSIAAYEQIFLQGASEGISFMFSSGDNGDELANTGLRQVDYPSSDPYVTAVGGTSDAIGPSGDFEWQTGWGTHKWVLSRNRWVPLGFLYGAGGGTSALFNQPAYQVGVAPPGARQVPDVGLDGDPTTGMLVGETQQFPDGTYYDEYRIGGTSLSSPLFAGMTALSLQNNGRQGVGLLNPTIYAQRATAFNDVAGNPPTPGAVRVDYANGVDRSDGLIYSVRTFNQDSSLRLDNGWDDITGVGSPNPAWLTAFGG